MIMFRFNKQRSTKMLVIYMISALLFLTFLELHIHTKEAASSADHGSAVSISSFFSELTPAGDSDEIKVSPDGVLKVNQGNFSILAVFLLAALIALFVFYARVRRLREINALLPDLPFHGTPPLRAPPQ